MKKKSFWLGMLAVGLTLALIVSGCGGDSDGDFDGDANLNGTWVDDCEYFLDIFKFKNGSFEQGEEIDGDYEVEVKGKYTTSDGKITMTATSYYMDGKALSKTQIKNFHIEDFEDMEGRAPNAEELKEIDDEIAEWFAPHTYNYSINGNTLTFDSYTYTKR